MASSMISDPPAAAFPAVAPRFELTTLDSVPANPLPPMAVPVSIALHVLAVGGLVIIPVGGGPARRLAATFSTAGWAFPQWSADGRTIYYLTQEGSHVAAVVGAPVDGGPARTVLRFDDPSRPWHRYGFRVRGGRIFFTIGDRQSDIWTAEILRP